MDYLEGIGGMREVAAAEEELGALLHEGLAKIDGVRPWLRLHLLFAVSTPFLWIATIVLALRRFGRNPAPGPHSRLHKTLGWASTADITMTSVTGLMFYYVAFIE